MHPQLAHDVLDVRAQRVRGYVEALADLRRGQTLGQGLEHFQFPRRERLDLAALGAALPGRGDALGDADDHRAGQKRLPGISGPHCVDYLVDCPVLGEVAVRAGLDRFEHRLVVREGGQHHYPGSGPAGLDCTSGFGPGSVG